MLKINIFFTSTKGVKFLSSLGPIFFTRRNVDEVKSQRDGASLSNYNPLVFIAKSSFYDCSTYDRLKKTNVGIVLLSLIFEYPVL